MVTNKTTRNACIATAIALVALLASAPTVAADDPTVEDDGSVQSGDCFTVNPWSTPPSWHLSVENCIEDL